ncbi:MAG: helix-turn-helix transcriptional regulator [Clostridia bacterium]|nr:helix-turn-helix domain-containing protein [Oscillospiraceae bacterium]MBQ8250041.1 helix-turn-helix transcriptional regulator [Clostridia bacterium]
MLKYQNENIGESYSFKCRFHKKYTVPPHIHEYSELAYVRTGNLTASINGERVIIPEGHAAFIFPNVIHEYTPETPCEMWCAVYSNDFLQTFFRLYPDSAPENCIIPLGESKKYAEALVKLDPTNIIKLTGMLHLLYSELANKTNMLPRSRNDNSLYHSAINYISQNFRSDITLTDMSKELGYHEKYLSSTLHSLTKMNFRTFLATYRINHAKSLLKSSESTIAEIAMDSGFASLNTFNRVFKDITGTTPSEYRKRKLSK